MADHIVVTAEDNTPFLHIVGTNHVAANSTTKITKAFADYNPDVVAIELDTARLQRLREDNRDAPSYKLISHIGFTGYVFARTAHFVQRRIGEYVGVMPGEEMLHAADLARNHGKPLHLVDQPMQDTLQALSHHLGFQEKMRMALDVLRAPFTSPPVDIDATQIPDEETIQDIVAYIKKRYPGIHKAIIADRDAYMANKLASLLDDGNDVLAVVGAAHKPGIKARLPDYNHV